MNRAVPPPARPFFQAAAPFFMALTALVQAAPPAPAPLDQLLKEGGVELVFYERAATPRRFPGQTTFTLNTEWRYQFQHDFRRRGRDLEATLRIDMQTARSTLTHKVELPREYDSPQLWDTSLARHELDHVLLSTDPRARLLNQAVLKSLSLVRIPIPSGQKPTEKFLRDELDAICDERRKAVTDLMNALQQRLDALTRNGNVAIADRGQFFSEAYGKEMLAELKFPYLEDVLKVVDSDDYETAGRKYVERFVLQN
ncbi:MAG TPA: hypothetical protein VL132_09100 [Planctomycetaceae bacterium]|nr:hypothetical protein [Planctomycetaceae bacterium]